MPDDKLVYWDSMVFIYRIQRHAKWIKELEQFTDAAERGELRIVTSAFTLAEVVKTPDGNLIPEDQERQIVEFFENDYIVMRNVDRFVAERAREIVRMHGLKPPDAIHVATAILSDVRVMHTCDDGVLAKNGQIGSPALRIEVPQWPGQQPLGIQMPRKG